MLASLAILQGFKVGSIDIQGTLARVVGPRAGLLGETLTVRGSEKILLKRNIREIKKEVIY